MRLLHIAPDIALGVRHRENGTQGAAALDLEGEAGIFLLEGIAHHGGRRQSPAQGRRGYRQSGVDLPGPLGQVPGGHRHRLHHAICCNCSY